MSSFDSCGHEADTFRTEGDMHSVYLMVLDQCEEYYEIDPEDVEARNKLREIMMSSLESCAEHGIGDACELLGDIYSEGLYDVPVDLETAWSYYVKGTEFPMAACWEKMYDMLALKASEGGEQVYASMDMCALEGARMKNRRMIIAAVGAYRNGRLTDYATEMEMYHIPAYDALPDEDDEDDEDDGPDDDGRYDAWA